MMQYGRLSCAGWVLCGYGLQPGADGEPGVVSEGSGRSVRVICLGCKAPQGSDEASQPLLTTCRAGPWAPCPLPAYC